MAGTRARNHAYRRHSVYGRLNIGPAQVGKVPPLRLAVGMALLGLGGTALFLFELRFPKCTNLILDLGKTALGLLNTICIRAPTFSSMSLEILCGVQIQVHNNAWSSVKDCH